MTGYDDLLKLSADLGKASYEATRKAQKVVAKTAHDIEADAKSLAPVDTGMLRNSISTTIGAGGLSAEIGPTVHYAPYLEYGTRRMPPQPYMGPAAERRAEPFVKAVEQLGGDFL